MTTILGGKKKEAAFSDSLIRPLERRSLAPPIKAKNPAAFKTPTRSLFRAKLQKADK